LQTSEEFLELGVHGDSTNRTKVAEMMRHHSPKSGDEQISFKEYVDRMKEDQNDIHYIIGESIVWKFCTWSILLMSTQCNS